MCIRRLQAGPAMALIDGGQNYEIAKKIVTTLRDEMESPVCKNRRCFFCQINILGIR